MVIDEGGTLRRCTSPYDCRVAGVVAGGSGRPGVILGADGDGKRALVALSGTVMAKVDATSDPVRVGGLLTTSASDGHAMAATDRDRAFGAVLGKAMASLSSGTGLLPVLVSLQ